MRPLVTYLILLPLTNTYMQHKMWIRDDQLDQPQQDVLVGAQRLVWSRQLECGGHLG